MTVMRDLDPFGFFVGHASAIQGLGGHEPSPDPRYCFHTAYQAVSSGETIFHLILRDVRATASELNVRVMALRPGADAAMVASLRVYLDLGDEPELRRNLRFNAVEGVSYALYGYLVDGSIVQARSVEIKITSLRDTARSTEHGGIRRSAFAQEEALVGAARLFSPLPPSFLNPVSQAYSKKQGRELATLARWPEIIGSLDDDLTRWKLALPLQVLAEAGMLEAPAQGLVFGSPHPVLQQALTRRQCLVTVAEAADEVAPTGCDFAIGFADAGRDVRSFCKWLVERVAEGGYAIAVLAVSRDQGEQSFRNRIQQAVLHLIGTGCSVMQMSLPRGGSWLEPGESDGAFALIVRR